MTTASRLAADVVRFPTQSRRPNLRSATTAQRRVLPVPANLSDLVARRASEFMLP